MAKGKQATASLRRQLEACDAHIDRLTDQVVDAKERARRFERDAQAVPALRAEVADLHRQLEAADSDRIAAVKMERDAVVAEITVQRNDAMAVAVTAVEVVSEAGLKMKIRPDLDRKITEDAWWEPLRVALSQAAWGRMSREDKRFLASPKRRRTEMALMEKQDNLQAAGLNFQGSAVNNPGSAPPS